MTAAEELVGVAGQRLQLWARGTVSPRDPPCRRSLVESSPVMPATPVGSWEARHGGRHDGPGPATCHRSLYESQALWAVGRASFAP